MLLRWSPSTWKPLSMLIGLLKIWVLIFMSLGPCYAACNVMRLFILKEIAGEMGWLLLGYCYIQRPYGCHGNICFYTYLSEEIRQTSPFFLFPFFKNYFETESFNWWPRRASDSRPSTYLSLPSTRIIVVSHDTYVNRFADTKSKFDIPAVYQRKKIIYPFIV